MPRAQADEATPKSGQAGRSTAFHGGLERVSSVGDTGIEEASLPTLPINTKLARSAPAAFS